MVGMKNFLVVLFLGILLVAAAPVYAIDGDGADPKSVAPADDAAEQTPVEEAESLLAEIDQGIVEINKLRQAMNAASGEQRETLLRQYQDEQLRIGNEVHEAAEMSSPGKKRGSILVTHPSESWPC